jgi:uncharacterized protein YbaR (Trm112 family)
MHLEVVQALRCPRAHEESWLVARTDRMEARHIEAGVLGCPVCGAAYPVAAGVAHLGRSVTPEGQAPPDHDAALRAAALLDLTTPTGFVVLAGRWAAAAVEVAALAEGVHVLGADAAGPPPPLGVGVSSIECGEVMPLGAAVARGIAVDAAHATPEALAAAATALAAGGRLLAPAAAPLPDAVTELARDDRWWVAEKAAPVPVVTLGSARRDRR